MPTSRNKGRFKRMRWRKLLQTSVMSTFWISKNKSYWWNMKLNFWRIARSTRKTKRLVMRLCWEMVFRWMSISSPLKKSSTTSKITSKRRFRSLKRKSEKKRLQINKRNTESTSCRVNTKGWVKDINLKKRSS